jgi:hypothetical protein
MAGEYGLAPDIPAERLTKRILGQELCRDYTTK